MELGTVKFPMNPCLQKITKQVRKIFMDVMFACLGRMSSIYFF